MKRVIAAVCLLCFSVGICVFSNILFNNMIDTVATQAEKCLVYAQSGNISELSENSIRLEEMWNEMSGGLTILSGEESLETISLDILALKFFADEYSLETYCEKCNDCLICFEILKRNEEINLYNIF
ncbi:MAG: DUF4363 family protein [Clostridia bacterium]|nr:DUF4363 family protein [Clostridia bacterium]